MIKNKTRKTLICKASKRTTRLADKIIGLMFSKKTKDTGLIFIFSREMHIDLHMFFVFFSIDVLFLDKSKQVAEIKENFKPFTFYIAKNQAKYILELPQGTVKKSKTKIGDLIDF